MEVTNKSGIHPRGNRILLKPMEIKKVSAGGIILSTESNSEREQMGNTTGIVFEMGDQCYEDYSGAWCAVGDKVIFAKYAGLMYRGRDGLEYRVINDTDITGYLDEDVDLVDPYLSKGI